MKTIKIYYWDANCHIALLNSEPTTDAVYLYALESMYGDMIDGKIHIVSCTMIQAEVFPQPEHRHIYEELSCCPNFSLIETVSSVFALARELRERCQKAGQRLGTPDATHIAAGHLAGVDEIWTTDKALVSKSKTGLLVTTPVIFPHIEQIRMVFGENT